MVSGSSLRRGGMVEGTKDLSSFCQVKFTQESDGGVLDRQAFVLEIDLSCEHIDSHLDAAHLVQVGPEALWAKFLKGAVDSDPVSPFWNFLLHQGVQSGQLGVVLHISPKSY